MTRRLCVFCGASPGADPSWLLLARELGALLGARGIGLVYGGARVGLMGALADAALAAGAEVIGVIPGALADREIAHTGLTALQVVESMHERKARMASLSDAFLAMPGGIGTLDELFEIWTWQQLRIHDRPVGVLDAGGFYGGLLAWLAEAERAGFVRRAAREALLVDSDAARIVDRLLPAAALTPS